MLRALCKSRVLGGFVIPKPLLFSFSFSSSHSHSHIHNFSTAKTIHFHSHSSPPFSPFSSLMHLKSTALYTTGSSSSSSAVKSGGEKSILQDIQPGEFHAKLQDPKFPKEAQLIDVREPHEVAIASLPGFTVLPLKQIGSWGPKINSKFDPQKDTYVLCHHGARSLKVSKWLQSQGFKKVYNISGGIHAYAKQADPSVPTYFPRSN